MRDDSGDVGPQEGLFGMNLGHVGDFSMAELSLDLLVVVEELGEANVAGRVELDLEGSVIGGESVALHVVRSEQPLALPLVSKTILCDVGDETAREYDSKYFEIKTTTISET